MAGRPACHGKVPEGRPENFPRAQPWHLRQLHMSYMLMRKQCLVFMLLLAASTAVAQELYLDEKTMPHVYVIVRCIYDRLFLYLMNSKSDVTYARTYILMRKQCLMFMLL